MATISNKGLVDDIIKGNGVYQGDPLVYSIVEYQSAFGGTCYGLNYTPENQYLASEYVREPKIIFERKE
jgi:hypothetical protein